MKNSSILLVTFESLFYFPLVICSPWASPNTPINICTAASVGHNISEWVFLSNQAATWQHMWHICLNNAQFTNKSSCFPYQFDAASPSFLSSSVSWDEAPYVSSQKHGWWPDDVSVLPSVTLLCDLSVCVCVWQASGSLSVGGGHTEMWACKLTAHHSKCLEAKQAKWNGVESSIYLNSGQCLC